jgi:predicted anti-sigma-YlaC factor YlaD
MEGMECDRCREILSARLDGEETPDLDGAATGGVSADAHLEGCGECQHFFAQVADLHRLLRVRPADEVPDLAPAILATAPTFTRREQPSVLRLALASVGIVLFLVAVPMLLHAGGGVTVHHLTRELAAFQAALGIGFALAAWQPARAQGLFPMALTVVAAMGFIATVDVLHGHEISLAEGQHLFELVGVVLLGLVARAEGATAPARRAVGFA